ncbi:hypothetical protein ACS0TY_021762 [Phlomoides rotata]
MVGIFSRFSVRGSHRRTQSALDDREASSSPPRLQAATTTLLASAASSAATHGIDLAVEFKSVEHPTEPLDNDQPIMCPLPEPSLHNDGRIWKERVSSVGERRVETREQTATGETPRIKHRAPNRLILPSISAPEHNFLKLLEESGFNT